MNYHYLVNFGLSSANFFALSMGLFMFSRIEKYLLGVYDLISKYYLNNLSPEVPTLIFKISLFITISLILFMAFLELSSFLEILITKAIKVLQDLIDRKPSL